MGTYKLCYDKISMEIVGINRDPHPNEGFYVFEGDLVVDMYMVDNDGTIEPAFPPDPTIDNLTMLNVDVNVYIYSKYDSGTQASFLAYYVRTERELRLRLPTGMNPLRMVDIEGVWDWIETVLAYYYEKKAQLINEEEVSWDFSSFDDTDPDLQLGNLMS